MSKALSPKTALNHHSHQQAFYRPADASRYLGVCRTKLHFLSEQDPDFPRKIRLSVRCVGWRKEDLDSWLELKSQQAKGG